MIDDEIIKEKLLLAYKISELYLKTGLAAQTLSNITSIPEGIIKESFLTVGKYKQDYLRLLPELGSDKTLTILQEKIDEEMLYTKRKDKRNVEPMLSNIMNIFNKEIHEVRDLYGSTLKNRIINLKINNEKIKQIAQQLDLKPKIVRDVISSNDKKHKK